MSQGTYTSYFSNKSCALFRSLFNAIEASIDKNFTVNGKAVILSVSSKASAWYTRKELMLVSYTAKRNYNFNLKVDLNNKKKCKVRITTGISENSVGYIEGIQLQTYCGLKFRIRIGKKLKTYISDSFELAGNTVPCSDVRTTPEDRLKIKLKRKAEIAEIKRLKLEALKTKVIKNYLDQKISVDTAILVYCSKTRKIEYAVVTAMLEKGFKYITTNSKIYICSNANMVYVPEDKVLIAEINNAIALGILTNA